MGIKRMLGRVALDRVRGERVSVPRALIAAMAVGVVAAVFTYRLLRR